MGIRLLQIDAFTTEPFHGNPAAVCLLDSARPADWMQAMADEMNLAETAFVVPRGGAEFDLRWFTPLAEVPLCGHATLASAHALWQTGCIQAEQKIAFHTLSGALRASLTEDGIMLDFPAIQSDSAPMPTQFEMMLSAPVEDFEQSANKYIAEVADEDAVAQLTPDLLRISKLPLLGVVATARGRDCDFVSRFFAPRLGVPEDPVTGSAHCVLATYWAKRLGKTRFHARQLSRRGGDLQIELRENRVLLTGHAVTIFDTTVEC